MNTIQELEAATIASLAQKKTIPDFGPGDTVRVQVRIVEGDRERPQAFEGGRIARRKAGRNPACTVCKN